MHAHAMRVGRWTELYERCFALPGHYLRPHQRHGGFRRLNAVFLVVAPRATEIELRAIRKMQKDPCPQNKLICHPNRARAIVRINFGTENINSKKAYLYTWTIYLLLVFFSSKINVSATNVCVVKLLLIAPGFRTIFKFNDLKIFKIE